MEGSRRSFLLLAASRRSREIARSNLSMPKRERLINGESDFFFAIAAWRRTTGKRDKAREELPGSVSPGKMRRDPSTPRSRLLMGPRFCWRCGRDDSLMRFSKRTEFSKALPPRRNSNTAPFMRRFSLPSVPLPLQRKREVQMAGHGVPAFCCWNKLPCSGVG